MRLLACICRNQDPDIGAYPQWRSGTGHLDKDCVGPACKVCAFLARKDAQPRERRPDLTRDLRLRMSAKRRNAARKKPIPRALRSRPSTRTRFDVLKRDGFKCGYCGASGVPLHVDHVIALARGGSNDMANLVTSCATCNLGKGVRPLLTVAQSPAPRPSRES